MDTIPYIGAPNATQSLMGLIIPLALAVSVLLLLSVWKPAGNTSGSAGKAFLNGAVTAAAVIWTALWSWMLVGYNADSAAAAETAALNLNAAYGLEISEEAAMAIVQNDLEGFEFKGQTPEGVMLLAAEWDEAKLHLYSMGFEAAVLDQAGDEH